MPDLILNATRLVCPASGFDSSARVEISDGKIVAVNVGHDGRSQSSTSSTTNIDNGILLPGLIDLHAHPANAGSRFGTDPDRYLLPRGSTTVLSQGDAGARNVDEYIEHTVEASRTDVKLAINFCANGESNPNGRFFSLDEASVSECVDAIQRHRQDIWGISLNIAFVQGKGVDPMEVMRRGIRTAEEAEVPVMFGATKNSAVPLVDQLALLRPGDVMTYCFHAGDGSIVENGRVLDCAWEARERGVLFDVGDGVAAFGFDAVEPAIAQGFLPDTISSDFYLAHVEKGIDHDLPLVVSKLIACGMTADQCWPKVTAFPAKILDVADRIGSIEEGKSADLCVLELDPEPSELRDGHGQVRMGRRWRTKLTVRSGQRVE